MFIGEVLRRRSNKDQSDTQDQPQIQEVEEVDPLRLEFTKRAMQLFTFERRVAKVQEEERKQGGKTLEEKLQEFRGEDINPNPTSAYEKYVFLKARQALIRANGTDISADEPNLKIRQVKDRRFRGRSVLEEGDVSKAERAHIEAELNERGLNFDDLKNQLVERYVNKRAISAKVRFIATPGLRDSNVRADIKRAIKYDVELKQADLRQYEAEYQSFVHRKKIERGKKFIEEERAVREMRDELRETDYLEQLERIASEDNSASPQKAILELEIAWLKRDKVHEQAILDYQADLRKEPLERLKVHLGLQKAIKRRQLLLGYGSRVEITREELENELAEKEEELGKQAASGGDADAVSEAARAIFG